MSQKERTEGLQGMSRDELVSGLIRIGEMEMTGEDRGRGGTPTSRRTSSFHGPDGRNLDYEGL